MSLIFLIVFLALIASALSLPIFEAVFLAVLLSPVLGHIAGLMTPLNQQAYYIILVAPLILLWSLTRRALRQDGSFVIKAKEAAPIVFFCVAFSFLHSLCLRWPDFIAMGERLRDYAILSAAYTDPVNTKEPWFAGIPINYYLYWYRFGHFLATTLNLELWEVYHMVAAFCSAFYMTAVFRILSAHCGLGWIWTITLSVFIGLGSNLAGVWNFLTQDSNWWGPSRVITGAINEFPAWSFLLGDLHPHYMNLGFVPFVIACGLTFAARLENLRFLLPLIFSTTIVALLWVYSANAWEVPVFFGLIVVFAICLVLTMVCNARISRSSIAALIKNTLAALLDIRLFSLLLIAAIAAVSLVHASLNLPPADQELSLVAGDIARSRVSEILNHWGLPLILVALSHLLLAEQAQFRVVAGAVMLGSLFLGEALPLLFILWGLSAYQAWQELSRLNLNRNNLWVVLFHALGVGSIAFIIVPEIVFLNDSYGGENERMNTIFKIYSASWFMLHAYSFFIVSRAWSELRPAIRDGAPLWLVQVVVVIFGLGFFVQVIDLRKSNNHSIPPVNQGLSLVEQRFPGAGKAIQTLERMQRGTVIEAQGNPYDYTTHVATLSGNYAYLGWTNHINLLYRAGGEVQRREQLTDMIYRETDCAQIANAMSQEGIRYLVLGPLEKARYGGINPESYGCLNKVVESGEYIIFGSSG